MECATCAAKSGSPPLCDSCLHNRALVSALNTELEKFQSGPTFPGSSLRGINMLPKGAYLDPMVWKAIRPGVYVMI